MQSGHKRWWVNRWALPGFSLFLGTICWVVFAIGGDPQEGAVAFGIMFVFAAILALGGRSESLRGLRGDGRDERWEMIDLRATALAGLVLISATIIGFLVEIAQGKDGSPYSQLAAISGVAYLFGLFLGRWRS